MKINESFLAISPKDWFQHPSYIEGKELVKHLKVVNDCAERCIKLATDFNESLTSSEEERQFIYQVVEHHRKKIPFPSKKTYTQ